jgi:hypothetical protein
MDNNNVDETYINICKTTSRSVLSIEKNIDEEQNITKCCICLEKKKQHNIVEYKCRRCKEGIVCSDCAVHLWTTNSHSKCPVCKNKTQGVNTWYNSYDVEMGYIRPPQIDDDHDDDDHDDDDHDDEGREQSGRTFVAIMWKNKMIISFITLIGLFISFIVGTVYKVMFNHCAWDCDKYEVKAFTIMTSILFGFIILVASLPILIFFSITIFGIICEGLKAFKKICIQTLIFCTRQCFDRNIRQNNKQELYNILKIITYVIFGVFVSFCIGTLYRISNNICYWNCKENDNNYTVILSIALGCVILVLILLSLCIIKACFSCIYIICNKLMNQTISR